MKPSSLIFPVLLVATTFALAQDLPRMRNLTYKISVMDSNSVWFKGYLYDFTDSSIKISQWPVRLHAPEFKDDFKKVDFRQVTEMTLKRNHGAGRGAWKGALLGTFFGVAAGLIEGPDPQEYWFSFTAGEKALLYGGLAGTVGTGLGALIGALVKQKYIIGGRKENFDRMKTDVLNRAYGNRPNVRQ